MLPLSSRPHARGSGGTWGQWELDGLASRCRRWTPALVAGAALVLLLCAAALNWRPLNSGVQGDCHPTRVLHPPAPPPSAPSYSYATPAPAPAPASAALSLALAPSLHGSYSNLRELIVVAGHAVLTGMNLSHDLERSEHWALLSYQKRQLRSFLSHIRRGVELARQQPQSMLLFAGGQTRRAAGPRSEGQSYWLAAEHEGWWTEDEAERKDVSARALTEEYSRDSFENVAFALARFHLLTAGRWPDRITLVGFPFKARRFSRLHRAALRWPAERWSYQGAEEEDFPADWSEEQKEAERALVLKGERENSYIPFLSDPYGCTAGPLGVKKAKRDPFRRPPPYEFTVPPMADLLRHCAGEKLFSGWLPWDPDGEELRKSEKLFAEERRRHVGVPAFILSSNPARYAFAQRNLEESFPAFFRFHARPPFP